MVRDQLRKTTKQCGEGLTEEDDKTQRPRHATHLTKEGGTRAIAQSFQEIADPNTVKRAPVTVRAGKCSVPWRSC